MLLRCGYPTHNCNEVAISLAQSANITVAIGNNIMHVLRAYHFHRLAARVPSFKLHIPLISTLRIGAYIGVRELSPMGGVSKA